MQVYRYWNVSYRHQGAEKVHTGAPLSTPDQARRQYAYWSGLAWTAEVTIVERTIRETRIPVAVKDLPAPGKATPPLPLPGDAVQFRRYFTVSGAQGRRCLPTGDSVRRYLSWVTEQRATNAYWRDVLPAPERLRVLDVRMVHRSRPVTPEQLPAR